MTEHHEETPWYRRGPRADTLPRRSEPRPRHLIGSDRVPLRVFLRRSAWDAIGAFGPGAPLGAVPDATDDPEDLHDVGGAERGGLLVGRPYADDNGPFIVIEGVIPADDAGDEPKGSPDDDRARHRWEALEELMRSRFPSEAVVGWFVVRSGQGVHLSADHRFTARRFFPEWWQLTYIIDPVRERQALFSWRDGRLQALPGFWVWDDVASGDVTADDTGVASAADTPGDGPSAGHPPWRRSSWLVAACLLLAAFIALPLPGSLSTLRRHVQEHARETERLSGELARLRERRDALQQLAQNTDALEGAGAPSAATPAEAVPGGRAYIVRRGDTLWSISERLLGDPYEYVRVAMENSLSNPNLILPGWELRLPTSHGDAEAGMD